MYKNSRDYAVLCDKEDELHSFRSNYIFPTDNEGTQAIYLCGNSLGLQPASAKDDIATFLDEWGALGVRGHFHGSKPWLNYSDHLHALMGQIVGASQEEVVIMNTLTVNLHMMLATFYQPHGKKCKILIESDAFPSDKYAIASFLKLLGRDPAEDMLEITPNEESYTLRTDHIIEKIYKHREELCLVVFGNTNYYTGQFFNMAEITAACHSIGCLIGFDCAHGAGNVPLELSASGADWAIWCTYKYLNSGPGNLGGVFVNKRHHGNSGLNRLSGWWGESKKRRFEMRSDFLPAGNARGWQVSNPPVIGLAAMNASLALHNAAGIYKLREKSIRLTGYLEFLIGEMNHPEIEIITPSNPQERGSQLSLLIHGHSKTLFSTIEKKGVIADWREPNVIRISPAPIYNSFEDVFNFAQILNEVLGEFAQSQP